jgi:hypothetical protein
MIIRLTKFIINVAGIDVDILDISAYNENKEATTMRGFPLEWKRAAIPAGTPRSIRRDIMRR